jgi:hypothetical protein
MATRIGGSPAAALEECISGSKKQIAKAKK